MSWAVFGERGSGTRWLTKILERRMPDAENLTNGHVLQWKHGLWGPVQDERAGSTIIVTIRKDIHAWLLSMHRAPHNMRWATKLSFSDFIRRESHSTADSEALQAWYGLRPREKFEPYPNVIQMWKAKHAAWDAFEGRVHHFDYFDLVQRPLWCQRQFSENCGVELAGEPASTDGYPKRRYYLDREYLEEISEKDLEFIAEQMMS